MLSAPVWGCFVTNYFSPYFISLFNIRCNFYPTFRLLSTHVRLALLHTATAVFSAYILNCLVFKHPFHIVRPSPWPLLASFSAFVGALGLVRYVGGHSIFCLALGLALLVSSIVSWFHSIIIESTHTGNHTLRVQSGLRLGFLLFIISEIFFFLRFFWAYLHIGSSPAIEIGSSWPPLGINSVDAFGLPLLNTALLLASAVSLTSSHHYLIRGEYNPSLRGLAHTVILGLYFLEVQAWEFFSCPFTLADSVFGSCFFLLTGFHGIHVFFGLRFLFVNLLRILNIHFSQQRHLGFEFAIWY